MTRNPFTSPKPKPPRPVESFGPEILAALLRGAKGHVEMEVTYRQAIRFRQRVHSLRNAMRLAAHPKYELCSKTCIGIEIPAGTEVVRSGRHFVPVDRGAKVKLILSPNDSEFAEMLAQAGIKPLAQVEAETKPVPEVTKYVPPGERAAERKAARQMTTLEAMFDEIGDPEAEGS